MSALLAFISSLISKLFAEVITDVLKTPAVTTEVETVSGTIDVPASNIDDVRRLFNRGEE